MKGLYITKKDQPLSMAKLESSTLSLIAKKSSIELMEQVILKGKMFVVYPAEGDGLAEFFYILEGEVHFEDEKITLLKGDCFFLSRIDSSANFRAITDVKILYVVNDSIFHELSDEMNALNDIITKVDVKDRYTKHHCMRVQEYSFQIASHMGIKGDMLESIQFASVFHDLGKLEIPNEILNKPGRLTKEEYDVIKTHSYHGSKIIKTLYFKNLEEIVLQHHEHVDGSGYPHGLKGDEIMLEAAIIAVADTFDAMTSDRPYRKALPASSAIEELIKYKGSHFRSDVVDAFLEVLIIKEDN